MPKLQTYQQRTSIPGTTGMSQQGRVDVSSGLQQAGQAMSQIGAEMQKREERRQFLNAKKKASDLEIELNKNSRAQEELAKQSGEYGEQYLNRTIENLDQWGSDVQDAASEQEWKYLAPLLLDVRNRQIAKAFEFGSKEAVQHAVTTAKNITENDSAIVHNDAAAYESKIGETELIVKTIENATAADAYRKDRNGVLTVGMLEGRLTRAVDAKSYDLNRNVYDELAGGEHDTWLNSDQKDTLMARAQRNMRTIEGGGKKQNTDDLSNYASQLSQGYGEKVPEMTQRAAAAGGDWPHKIAVAERSWEYTRDLPGMTPAEENAIREELSGKLDKVGSETFKIDQGVYKNFETLVQAKRKAIRDDGAQYVQSYNEAARSAYSDLLALSGDPESDPAAIQAASDAYMNMMDAEYDHLGVPKAYRRIVPVSQSMDTVNDLNGLTSDPQQMESYIVNMERTYGENIGRVINEMSDKLNDTALGMVVTQTRGGRQALANTHGIEISEIIKTTNSKPRDITSSSAVAASRPLEIMRMQPGGVVLQNRYMGLMERMTAYHHANGMGMSEAADLAAAELFGDKEYHGKYSFGVPSMYKGRQVNVDAINSVNTGDIIRHMDMFTTERIDTLPSLFGVSEDERKRQTRLIAEDADMVGTNDGSGVYLMVTTDARSREPLTIDGEKVVITWGEMESWIAEREELRRRVPLGPGRTQKLMMIEQGIIPEDMR
jgi:hypothetical protein